MAGSNQPPRFLNYFFSTYLLIYEDMPVAPYPTDADCLFMLRCNRTQATTCPLPSAPSASFCLASTAGQSMTRRGQKRERSSVAQLKATDPEGEPLIYGVSGEEAMKYFSVNKDTGVVWLRQQLDRETKSEMQVEFYVSDIQEVVKDIVKIQIGEVNDNVAIFQGEPYIVHIEESHKEGEGEQVCQAGEQIPPQLLFSIRHISMSLSNLQ
ncbi:unnamed protein product [Tetraodon nigroviridis]|uniref:(spotted green pufferfish) hypothetical protein n=1 Tax=Tetraodon nigroviridis TaxID=99883 RepID=Q4S3N8_TETNG|nr:unnamed protein product [Tetraodon nigroviridis]